jgi:DNA recombination protein RmuC
VDIVVGILSACLVLAVGVGIAGWLNARAERARRADLQDRLDEAEATLAQRQEEIVRLTGASQALQARLEEREAAATQAQAKFDEQMRQTIDALSQHALSRNSEEFLKLAAQTMETLGKQTEGARATGEERIRGMVEPLAEALKRYDLAIQEMERRREGAYSTLEEWLRAMVAAEQGLQSETNKLVTALRRPEVRGRWGEMTLRNAVEMVGMSEHCDFIEQHSVATETGVLRPDMIVRLPGGGTIVVDNKVPMDAYLQALDATDPAAREQHLRTHAAQCRKHIGDLAKKAYWDQFESSPNCVVMFIPMESLYAAALEADGDLMRGAFESRVVIATPATFIALLHTVAHGWSQQTLADNLLEVRSLAGEFYSRLLTFAGHFTGVGKSLSDAVNRYNNAVNSANSRLYTQAARLKELGVPAKEDLPELKAVEVAPLALRGELQDAPTDDEEPSADEA